MQKTQNNAARSLFWDTLAKKILPYVANAIFAEKMSKLINNDILNFAASDLFIYVQRAFLRMC